MEKQENQRLQKQSEGQKSEISSLTKDREKLQKDVGNLEVEVIELKEMVRHAGVSLFYVLCFVFLLRRRNGFLERDSFHGSLLGTVSH